MRTLRCKCGDSIMWTTDSPCDCQGCPKCNTTYAGHPDSHKELQPHTWKTMYNQNTGKPYKRCEKCSNADEESYKASGKSLTNEEKELAAKNMDFIYNSELNDSERFVKMYEKKYEKPPEHDFKCGGKETTYKRLLKKVKELQKKKI